MSFSTRPVFKTNTEDFFKIIFPAILIFLLSNLFHLAEKQWFYLALAFLLDQGHVYSTMIEVYFDKEEIRRPYVAKVTLFSFFLNLAILIIFPSGFFYYIFYFTVYHNMRQGLGFVFINQTNNNLSRELVKWFYYFSTVVPFVLFHFRYHVEFQLSSAVLKNINLFNYFSFQSLAQIYHWGLYTYIALWIFIILFLWKNKFTGLIMFIYFSLIYSSAFLILNSSVNSYGLLILSHAIPYYFLFEERIHLTHSSNLIRKYSHIVMILFFLLGAVVDYFYEELTTLFDFPFDKVMIALVLTPLICHFIFDSILWTRNNERYQKQKLLRATN